MADDVKDDFNRPAQTGLRGLLSDSLDLVRLLEKPPTGVPQVVFVNLNISPHHGTR